MIYTGSHNNCQENKKVRLVAISGNRGHDTNYQGEYYSSLAPKLSFWKIWHDNIDKISTEENNRYYIKEYYEQVLSKLDPYKIYKDLDNSVLLCYEDNLFFCHRHIVATWLNITLGINIPEIKVNSDGFITELSRPTNIKIILEEVMHNDITKLKIINKNF